MAKPVDPIDRIFAEMEEIFRRRPRAESLDPAATPGSTYVAPFSAFEQFRSCVKNVQLDTDAFVRDMSQLLQELQEIIGAVNDDVQGASSERRVDKQGIGQALGQIDLIVHESSRRLTTFRDKKLKDAVEQLAQFGVMRQDP